MKTIIHHEVAARVVCVTSEHDAHVAARVEAHEQRHQHQPVHICCRGGGSWQSRIDHAGPSRINAASQGQPGSAGVGPGPYPPLSVQRQAQLAQQGLGGMGGKTGLSFDVILSRLQGDPQKSKQTGRKLDSLTGAMHVI